MGQYSDFAQQLILKKNVSKHSSKSLGLLVVGFLKLRWHLNVSNTIMLVINPLTAPQQIWFLVVLAKNYFLAASSSQNESMSKLISEESLPSNA